MSGASDGRAVDEFDNEFDDIDQDVLDSVMQDAESALSATQVQRDTEVRKKRIAAAQASESGTSAPTPAPAVVQGGPQVKRPRLDPEPGNSSYGSARLHSLPPRRRVTQIPREDEQMPDISVGVDGSYRIEDEARGRAESIQPAHLAVRSALGRSPSPGLANGKTNGVVNGTSEEALAKRPTVPPRRQVDINRENAYKTRIERLTKDKNDLREQLEALQNQQKAARESVHREVGELSILRSKVRRIEEENLKLRKDMLEREEKHKEDLVKERKEHEESLQHLKTVEAFSRFERETSRWARPPRNIEGPTTPSRRAKDGAVRTPASVTPRRRVEAEDMEDSPSRRPVRTPLDRRKQNIQVTPVKEFAGFQNAFLGDSVEEARKKKPRVLQKATTPKRGRDDSESQLGVQEESAPYEDDLPPLDDLPLEHRQEPEIRKGPQEQDDAQRIRIWASAEMLHARSDFLGFLLSHESLPHTRNSEVPLTRYMTEVGRMRSKDLYVEYASAKLPATRSTLARVVSHELVEGTHEALHEYHAHALDALVRSLAREPQDIQSTLATFMDEYQRMDLAAAHRILDQSFLDLLQEVAQSLRMLLGLFLRICMMDAFNDVMQLCADISFVYPVFLSALEKKTTSFPGVKQPDHAGASSPERFTIPVDLDDIFLEVTRKSWGLPLSSSAPDSAVVQLDPLHFRFADEDDGDARGPHWNHKDAVDSRRRRKEARMQDMLEKMKLMSTTSWHMEEQVCEETIQAMLSLMRAYAEQVQLTIPIFRAESLLFGRGVLASLLQADRAAPNLVDAIKMINSLCNAEDLLDKVIKMEFDDLQKPPDGLKKSKTPLLEILAKHLVDRRVDLQEEDAHNVHVAIMTLLSTMANNFEHARVVMCESKHLLAALVSNISADVQSVWSSLSSLDATAFQATLHRIFLDVTLMMTLHEDEIEGQGLCAKLDSPQTQALLNGIKHSFIVSFSRLAFADEPEWAEPLHTKSSERWMESMAEMASSMLELVLSPDELDEIWQALAGDVNTDMDLD